MLQYDELRQVVHDHRLHHEADAEATRLATQARGGRVRRARPLAGEIARLRTAHRQAMERAACAVVTLWPRR